MNFQRRLFRCLLLLPALLAGSVLHAQSASLVKSPDGRLAVEFKLNASRAPVYLIRQDGKLVFQESRLGLIRDDADFSQGLVLTGESKVTSVKDKYEILTAKRRFNNYRANRKEFHLVTADGKKMDIIFQVSDDGVAFRYFFPETSTNIYSLKEEVSSFHFQSDTKAWLQPMQVAKTGYGSSNPAYEEFYSKGIPVGTPSALGAGWVYPALFQSGETWVAITEGSLGWNYCATRLRDQSPDGEYSVGFPDPRETIDSQPVNPLVAPAVVDAMAHHCLGQPQDHRRVHARHRPGGQGDRPGGRFHQAGQGVMELGATGKKEYDLRCAKTVH